MLVLFRSSLRKKFLWKKEIEGLVYEIAEQLLSDPSMDISSMIQQRAHAAEISSSDKRNSVWLQSYCIHTAGMLKRKRIIESLKSFSIELFGDADGWQELVGDGFSIHPPVDYATKLPGVYSSISVNLNITSSQMSTAVNQRVFDIPVSGNFLITDYQKDLDELFDKDEIVVYRSNEELAELYLRYRNDEHSRRRITQRARERILSEHTYIHRYESIRNKMFS
jgi:spore maturation protein CgeB